MSDTEPVRIKKEIVSKVRKLKVKTGIPIGRFIEESILERIKVLSKINTK